MTALPLDLYPVLESTDLDETRELIWREMGKHPIEPVGPVSRVNALINGRYISRIAVVYMAFGAEMRTHPGGIDYYVFQMPLRGEYHVRIDGHDVEAQLGRGVVISPHQDVSTWWSMDCGVLHLRIAEVGLRNHVYETFGVRVTDPLRFKPEVNLARGPMRDVYLRLVVPLLRSINTIGSPFDNMGPATQVEQALMTALLTAQPHTYSSQLNRHRGTASTWP